jgi:hypothetical protein
MNLNSIYNFIDWTKGDDVQIAAALGVTRQAVAAARKVRRVAPVSKHGGRRPGAGRKAKAPSEPANASDHPRNGA